MSRPPRWPGRVLVVAGGLVTGYAVVGALGDPDVRPVRHLLFLAAVLVAHDAVLLPAAIGVGVLIDRYLPAGWQAAVRAAGLVSVTLLVVAAGLVLGFGRDPDNPSALPLRYGRGLVVTLLLVWTAALLRAGAARLLRAGASRLLRAGASRLRRRARRPSRR